MSLKLRAGNPKVRVISKSAAAGPRGGSVHVSNGAEHWLASAWKALEQKVGWGKER